MGKDYCKDCPVHYEDDGQYMDENGVFWCCSDCELNCGGLSDTGQPKHPPLRIKPKKKSLIFSNISAFLVILLIGIALLVFIGKAVKLDMWIEIALYWGVLTVKNLCDLIALVRKEKR